MSHGRIYRAPCGMTHKVIKDRYPKTLDAELGAVPEGQGIESLSLAEKFEGCKTCDKVKANPCFSVGNGPKFTAVTQFVCPGWTLTMD